MEEPKTFMEHVKEIEDKEECSEGSAKKKAHKRINQKIGSGEIVRTGDWNRQGKGIRAIAKFVSLPNIEIKESEIIIKPGITPNGSENINLPTITQKIGDYNSFTNTAVANVIKIDKRYKNMIEYF